MRNFAIAALALLIATPAVADGFGGQHSTTTSQTTVTTSKSGDTTTTTTTTRTDTASHGGGFAWGFGGPGPAPSYDTLGGSWQIGEARGDKLCALTLESKKFISNYGARTSIGCPEGLFGVSSWLLLGDEIRLLSPAGSVLAKLRPAGHGRWNGHTVAGLEIFMTRP